MELTLDQALQHAAVAHNHGDLKEAERIYLHERTQPSRCQSQFGCAGCFSRKPLRAIPLFKSALQANPAIEQFWLSYIDLLVALDRSSELNRF